MTTTCLAIVIKHHSIGERNGSLIVVDILEHDFQNCGAIQSHMNAFSFETVLRGFGTHSLHGSSNCGLILTACLRRMRYPSRAGHCGVIPVHRRIAKEKLCNFVQAIEFKACFVIF